MPAIVEFLTNGQDLLAQYHDLFANSLCPSADYQAVAIPSFAETQRPSLHLYSNNMVSPAYHRSRPTRFPS